MDEPTAALAMKEVGKVLDLIKGLKSTASASSSSATAWTTSSMSATGSWPSSMAATSPRRRSSEIDRNEVIGWIMGNKSGSDAHRPGWTSTEG